MSSQSPECELRKIKREGRFFNFKQGLASKVVKRSAIGADKLCFLMHGMDPLTDHDV